jgi:hypothetical protein
LHLASFATIRLLCCGFASDKEDSPMFPVAAAVALAFTFALDPMEAEEVRLLNLQLARFPPKKMTEACLDLNSKQLDWLELVQTYLPSEQVNQWYEECSKCEDCWRHLYSAQDVNESLSLRFHALEELKKELGRVAFFQGQMPPPVPIWRFKDGPPPLGTLPAPSRFKQTGVISNPPPP